MRSLQMICLGFAVGVLFKATAEPNGQGQNQNQIQNQRPNPTALTWGNSPANGLQTGP
jgi:hypothetical protein